jgi:hypothetical protein
MRAKAYGTEAPPRDGAIGFVEFAKAANDYCQISNDRHQQLAKWVNATIVENRLRMDDVDSWWRAYPEDGNFLGKVTNDDANARKILCDTLDAMLDYSMPYSPFPVARGYPKRRDVTCAFGFRSANDLWCDVAKPTVLTR